MTKAKYITFLILISAFIYGQDSVTLTITKVKEFEDKKVYRLKDQKSKSKYFTICPCMANYKKGDVLVVTKEELDRWMMYGIIPQKLKL